MENPETDIIPIIHHLTTSPPNLQQQTLETFFVNNASFTHPFCRTLSFLSLADFLPSSSKAQNKAKQRTGGIDSRFLLLQIYKWYKVLSPRIDIVVDSVAWDKAPQPRGIYGQGSYKETKGRKIDYENKLADGGLLYVSIRQRFRLWPVSVTLGYRADVRLVTVLSLTRRSTTSSDGGDGEVTKYYITHQEDLYQTNEWIKFLFPWSLGWGLVVFYQVIATLACCLGAVVLGPLTTALEKWIGGDAERGVEGAKNLYRDKDDK